MKQIFKMLTAFQYRWFLAFLLCSLFSITSCNDTPTNNNNEKLIKIGALLPLSGSGSSTGESMNAAIDLYLNDINNKNNDYKIELYKEDTQTKPETALEKLKYFKSLGITYIVGPYSSAELEYIKDYADSNNMILISPSSVAISLAVENDNIFRMATNDYIQVKAVSKYFDKENLQSIFAIYRNDTWGNSIFWNLFNGEDAENFKFFGEQKYPTITSDYTEYAILVNDKIKDEIAKGTNKDKIGVYLACFGEGTNMLEKSSSLDNSKNVKWIGTSAFALNSTIINNSSAADFSISTDFVCPVYAPDEDFKSQWSTINSLVKTKIGREPESYALTAYDAIQLAYRASILLKNTALNLNSRTALIEYSNNNDGITGNLKFDKYGDRLSGNYNFWKIRKYGSKYEWYSKYIYNSKSGELSTIE